MFNNIWDLKLFWSLDATFKIMTSSLRQTESGQTAYNITSRTVQTGVQQTFERNHAKQNEQLAWMTISQLRY